MERIIIAHKNKDGAVVATVCLEGYEPEIFWEDVLKYHDRNWYALELANLPKIVGFSGKTANAETETKYQKSFENLDAAIEYFQKKIKERRMLWFNGWMYLYDEEQDSWLVSELAEEDPAFVSIDERLKGLNRYSVTITENIDKTIWIHAKNVEEANARVVAIYEQGGLEEREGIVRDARVYGFKMNRYNDYDGEEREGSLWY